VAEFISAANLQELARHGKQITLNQNCVLTPAAKDVAKDLGLTITRGNRVMSATGEQVVWGGTAAPMASSVAKVISADKTGEAAEQGIRVIVQEIMDEVLKPACPNPRAVHVRGEEVVIQPFQAAPAGQRVGLTDVITAREGNLCAGFMTFDHSELPWLLTYDEADYIVEGDFVLQVADKVFRAKAGDVVYIPKGSRVVFSSPTFCKVFYVTYPANWAEVCQK
jgi:ethanolamine utilization protein EutQ